MTSDIPRPLRRALLLRASLKTDACPEAERDRIIRVHFPGLDLAATITRLEEAREARRIGTPERSEQIVADLIQEDQEART